MKSNLDRLHRAFLKNVGWLQVVIIGVHTRGLGRGEDVLLLARQISLQARGRPYGNPALDAEDILVGLLELVGPGLKSALGIYQGKGRPYPVSRELERSHQDGVGIELASDALRRIAAVRVS